MSCERIRCLSVSIDLGKTGNLFFVLFFVRRFYSASGGALSNVSAHSRIATSSGVRSTRVAGDSERGTEWLPRIGQASVGE
jgi:hypothetical protein